MLFLVVVKGRSVPDLPAFSLMDMKPKFLRQDSIVRDTGLLCSLQSALDDLPEDLR